MYDTAAMSSLAGMYDTAATSALAERVDGEPSTLR